MEMKGKRTFPFSFGAKYFSKTGPRIYANCDCSWQSESISLDESRGKTTKDKIAHAQERCYVLFSDHYHSGKCPAMFKFTKDDTGRIVRAEPA